MASVRAWSLPMLAAIASVTVAAACTDAESPDAPTSPDLREVVVDRGTAGVVDLRSVTVEARPGDVVVLRSANPGRGKDDESPVHHLFTSAPSSAPPPLFTRAGSALTPNAGVWGLCRGGAASNAADGCPVPPIEGPAAYDGKAYFSLGSLLPGEARELPLADELPPGTYRFTCAIHPQHHVDVEVVTDPRPAPDLGPLDPRLAVRAAERHALSAAGGTVVVLGPQVRHPAAEVLAAVPAVIRIPVGGTVVWRVGARSPHTVELGSDAAPHLADTTPTDTIPRVPHGGRWDGTGQVRSGILSADPGVGRTEFALTFTRAGRYRAFDRFHAGVSTLVRVQ
jgi:plastocyanin